MKNSKGPNNDNDYNNDNDNDDNNDNKNENDNNNNNHISECSKLAQKEYKTRHDWVGKVIHW